MGRKQRAGRAGARGVACVVLRQRGLISSANLRHGASQDLQNSLPQCVRTSLVRAPFGAMIALPSVTELELARSARRSWLDWPRAYADHEGEKTGGDMNDKKDDEQISWNELAAEDEQRLGVSKDVLRKLMQMNPNLRG